MEPAFVIFRRYQQRSRERMAYAIELLAKKPDFDVDESFNFDREKEPWPANAAEMNELWRKRVKNDALSLVIAGKQWPEVVDVLRKRYEHVAKRLDQSKPEDVFEAFMNAYVLSPRSAFELLLAAQFRGIQHSNEPQLRGHRRLAAAHRRLRDGHRRDRRRPRRRQRHARGQRPHHRGRRRAMPASSPTSSAGGSTTSCRRSADPAARSCACRCCPREPRRDRRRKIVEFTRNRISLEAQAAHKALRVIERNGRDVKVGVITVPSFYQDYDASRAGAKDFRSTTRDVQRLIERAAQGRRRGADHGPARERRRLPAGGGVADRSVHRSRPGRAAARHDRAHRSRRRSGSGDFLFRAARSCSWIGSARRRPRSSPARFRIMAAA